MKTSKIAIVLSFLLGGAVAAVVYTYLGPTSIPGFSARDHIRSPELSLQETTRGELTQASPINYKDGSRYQLFNLQPDQAGLLRIRQQGALDAEMVLLSENNEVLQTGLDGELFHNFGETPQRNLRLVVSGSNDRAYGPFRIDTDWLDVLNEGALALDTEIQGYLGGEANQYQFVVDDAALYQIDMSSSAFDSFLKVTGNGVNMTDDDSGDNLDARLSVMLEPGEYTITATAPYHNASDTFGMFNLQVTRISSLDDYQQDGAVEVGDRIYGFLQHTPLTYSFSLDTERQVRIALSSDAFDTLLELRGDDMNLENDDGGGGTNSLINQRLPAGDYSLVVRAYSSGQGEFSLQID